jgi:hypothetical protein
VAKIKAKTKKSARHHVSGRFTTVLERSDKGSRGSWTLRDSSGRTKTVLSSESAKSTMDKALTKYGDALKRLVDR